MGYNAQTILIPNGSYTTEQVTAVMENPLHRGILLGLHLQTNPGGGETLTVTLFFVGKEGEEDQAVASQVTVGAGAGTYRIIFAPGASSTPDGSRNKTYAQRLARRWRAKVTPSAGGTWVYRLDADMLY